MDHQSPYRETTVGKSLLDSLDELMQKQRITPQLAQQVGQRFDQAASSALAKQRPNWVSFRGRLRSYKPCKEGWTFFLKNVEFREATDLVLVDNVKITASKNKATEDD